MRRAHVGAIRRAACSQHFVGGARQGVTDVLAVTFWRGPRSPPDRRELAAPSVPAWAASAADGEQNLVAGSGLVLSPS
jgi:hypothetical protein